MKFLPPTAALCVSMLVLGPAQTLAQAQNGSNNSSKSQAPKTEEQTSHVTVEVSGGQEGKPVENASVYIKYPEGIKSLKEKKLELNVKTNKEGSAHVPAAPRGRVLIQVVADGWKTYGRWYDITDPKQTFQIHLEKPPKWY
jgi:hypothetical protein